MPTDLFRFRTGILATGVAAIVFFGVTSGAQLKIDKEIKEVRRPA